MNARRFGFASVLAALSALPLGAQSSWEDQGKELVGKPAPDFVLKDTTEKEWKLSDLKGKKFVLIDFGSTCRTCQETVKDLEVIHQAYKQRGLQVLTVCGNAPDMDFLREFVAAMKLTYPVLWDSEYKAGEAYEVEAVPFTVIVGKDGVVRWVHTGHPEDYKPLLREQLDALLPAEAPDAPKETPQ
jgi:peroxiredoxin